nr:MAG TPA: hypothetical protein [Caudoviricetes sp.]
MPCFLFHFFYFWQKNKGVSVVTHPYFLHLQPIIRPYQIQICFNSQAITLS